jgi:hypothetical protein
MCVFVCNIAGLLFFQLMLVKKGVTTYEHLCHYGKNQYDLGACQVTKHTACFADNILCTELFDFVGTEFCGFFRRWCFRIQKFKDRLGSLLFLAATIWSSSLGASRPRERPERLICVIVEGHEW